MFSIREKSLYVSSLDLWIDSLRARARCYVSHGHSDHARAHETVVTTPHSAAVCRRRFGARARTRAQASLLTGPSPVAVAFEEHAYNEPWDEGGHRLTLFSAGHVLGSAQLLIEGPDGRFVYTGDFKLGRAYTCEPAEVKPCDVVLMECTYGRPQYVFPPRDLVEEQMVDFALRALDDGAAPVFYAYSLGKAQEAMAILGKANIPLTLHGAVDAMAQVYVHCGVRLPGWEIYDAATYDGTRALIWPPSGKAKPAVVKNRPVRTAMLTGWALGGGARYQFGVDAAFALSDHADFPSLLEYIERAQPRKVLLNHGWRDFVWRLRRLGIDAVYLEPNEQLALF
ncbi:MAG: MBL fold metallo-hydrolase RNA specificity domain-containing protein [Candidatus Velthaea sp.]